MFPYKDDNPTQTFPFVTIGIITINILAYLWEILSPAGERYIIYNYGAIPSGLLSLEKTQALHPMATVFSSMFLHGGLLHIGGNMLYLWIFGNNIEDRLGHFQISYLLSCKRDYSLICTCFISAFFNCANDRRKRRCLRCSRRLYTFIPSCAGAYPDIFGFFIQVIKIPALIVIGFWAIIQVINGILSQGLLPQGGVAWFAHIGGFLTGLLTIKIWLPKRRFREWS